MSDVVPLSTQQQLHRFKAGSCDYRKAVAALYERKERCGNEVQVGLLIDEIRDVIEELEYAGSVQGRLTALVLRAHQIDNWYCKCGHAKLSSESRRPLVSKCQDKAESEATAAQAKFKQLERDVKTADEKRQCFLVGVWVHGYSAMQKLTAKDHGAADDLLQKALECLRQIDPNADIDKVAAQRSDCLLESGFLNNCFGRYHRDSYNIEVRHSHRTDGTIGVCKYFKHSLEMFEILENEMSDGSFRHEVILMNVNIVRTLLGNPDEKMSWGWIPNKETLDLCEKHMEEAQKLKKRWDREELRDRLNFRLELFQAYLYIKQAVSKWKTLSTNNSVNFPFNGCCRADTEYAKKAELHRCQSMLGKAVYCFQQCKEKFGDFYTEMRVVPELFEWIKNYEGPQLLKRLRGCDRNRHSESQTSDTGSGTSGSQSSSESGARKKRSRNPSQCENQNPSQFTEKGKHRKKCTAPGNSAPPNALATCADAQPTDGDGAAYDGNPADGDSAAHGYDGNPASCLDQTEAPQLAVHSNSSE